MAIVGFNFKRLMIEKLKPAKGKLNIKNNVSVTKVEKADLDVDKSKGALDFEFKYTTRYDPEVGNIVIDGNVLVIEDKKKADGVLKKWKKDKQTDQEMMVQVLRTVLNKCNIESLLLSKEVGLPSPVKLPEYKFSQEKKK